MVIKKKDMRSAMGFVILMGLISLCSDMVYEGARSITGPYLLYLGATASVVGFVAGLGELLGYTLRILTGFLADKTKQYWLLTIIGYVVNLLAVPALGLVGRWDLAAICIVMERAGKAIRTPARDAMLSHATKRIGTGWGFGLHEALDQIGALLGPIVVAIVLFMRGAFSYQMAFLILGIPVSIALGLVFLARIIYANPLGFESKKLSVDSVGLKKTYWIYLAATAFIALGFADFPLMAFHIKKTAFIADAWIPLLYALAMGVDGLAALLFGVWFDRKGLSVLAVATAISLFFAPLVFLGSASLMIVGVLIWGIGMGAQESIMRAGIATLVPAERRGSGYGIFNTVFGIAWFLGSVTMGALYDNNIIWLVVFSVVAQAIAIPIFLQTKNK